MESIGPSAIAGLIAGVVAPAILAGVESIRKSWLRRRDVKAVRDLLTDGRKRVMEAETRTYHGMPYPVPADVLRAAHYNKMIKQLDGAFNRWAVNLSPKQMKDIKDIFDALDWYHTDPSELLLISPNNHGEEIKPIELPDGIWPLPKMQKKEAEKKFDKLQSIKWLQLQPIK